MVAALKPNAPTPKFKCVWLDAEVTYDFCHYEGRREKAYSLLHRNGSYIRAENTNDPVVATTWSDAVRLAELHSAPHIVIFHEERIKHRRDMPNGGVMWDRVLFWLHECAEQYEHELPTTVREPDAHGRSQTSFKKAKQREDARLHRKRR